ncbi:uncharacterized protein CC84DRAFT_1221051 [Paraphaeosphaeria sporulosa]|uniref:Zinc finger PHD-type domain-containing protein n=1 Tax=Paraphaeosphaeria sporulosa TaxID=1460663 RepID=A0A177C314_9PLEO|nr:uncharacterized protein CC84DRAFT_1221051 [Paraphaeosphaeria sporulosa]OAG01561.1 hypothetical protein CC84DRAFT_1221051 [Paraphaeosphaeria sporulosa]
MDPKNLLKADPPPLPGGVSTGDVRDSSTTWASVNNPRDSSLNDDLIVGGTVSDSEAELRLDQNNAIHVDTSDDRVYDTDVEQDVGHYRLPAEGQAARQIMRNHLNSLLPRELVQDEFGTVVSMDKVSSQHLAKLQGKVWRELPLMVALTANGVDGEITTESIIAVQSVCYIADLISKMNYAFVLHPRSIQPCHSALCRHVHEKLEKPYSEHEVTLEPLVDWMTLDPIADITSLWFTLFRRNKSLLHKFALSNSKFIPRNPLRFCLECLSFMADERNLVWCMIKEDPDIIYADVPMPWLMPGDNNEDETSDDKGGKNSTEDPWSSDSDSGDSGSCSSEGTGAPSKQVVKNDPQSIPNVEGAFDLIAKPCFRKLEIWRDPRPAQLPLHLHEGQPTDHLGWTIVNPPSASSSPSNETDQLSVDTERRFGAELDPNLKFQGGYPLVSLSDLETTDSDIETSDSEPEINGARNAIETTRPNAETPVWDMDSAYVLIPATRTAHNAFSHGYHTWPAPKESTSPVPARPAPGFDITPKDMYPYPNQLICSCRQPAKTDIIRIVECKKSECFIRWYHYACLKDQKEKGAARFGTFQCELCKGEEYWGKAQAQCVTDLSMPPSHKQVVEGLLGMGGASGAGDPYGFGGD